MNKTLVKLIVPFPFTLKMASRKHTIYVACIIFLLGSLQGYLLPYVMGTLTLDSS